MSLEITADLICSSLVVLWIRMPYLSSLCSGLNIELVDLILFQKQPWFFERIEFVFISKTTFEKQCKGDERCSFKQKNNNSSLLSNKSGPGCWRLWYNACRVFVNK